jgi:serine/threonine protein kinase/WD40 repeat protein
MSEPTGTSAARDELLNQLADEFAARQRAGERPGLEEYCRRHPDLADDIQSLFPALIELERAKTDAGPELAVAEMDAPPVTLLGDFRLLREVGRGGMGVVYEAEQLSLGRRVAIKLLPAAVFRDPVKKRRFEREAKAAGKLHHTNIVPVHGFGEHDGTPYYVMQFIPGLGLDAVIDELARLAPDGCTSEPSRPRTGRHSALSVALARSLVGVDGARTDGWNGAADNHLSMTAAGGITPGPASLSGPGRSSPVSFSTSGVRLPGQSGPAIGGSVTKKTTYWESVARIGVQVAGALAYAHKQGVLHRDIKPGNLLLDLDGTVWVTDFGLAKADDSDNLTHTGDLLGTLRYMPPEAFEGKSDARGDVYALGLTLYELLARRPAFDEKDRNKLVKEVTTGEPTPLDKVRRETPRDLVTIVQKAIEREPARRYATAEDLAADLRRFLDDQPIHARRQTHLERCIRWARHHPGIAVLGGVLTGVLVLVTVASLLAAGYFNRLRQNEALAAQRERDARAAEVEQKQRAEEALQDAIDQTYLATRNEIRAMRLAHESGWRSAALERIRGLVHLGSRKFDRVELRTEALACLAEIDVRIQSTFGDPGTWHIQFSPDGRTLASADERGRVYLRDLATNRDLPPILLPKSKRGMTPLAFHAGGALAVASEPGRVTFHALAPDQPTFPAIDGDGYAFNIAFSSSGGRVAVAWVDEKDTGIFRRVTVHETATGAVLRTIVMPADTKVSMYKVPLALSPDGQFVATAGPAFGVQVHSVVGDSKPVTLGRLDDRVCAIAFHPEGRSLAAAGFRVAALWDLPSRSERFRIHGPEDGFWDIAFSPDGRLLAGVTNDGWGRLWDGRTGRDLAAVPAQIRVGLAAAFSPQGDRFAVGGAAVSVLAIEGGRARRTETSQTNYVGDVAFDPVQPVLFHCGGDQRVYAWSLDKNGAQVNKTTRLLSPAVLRLTPGGREVVLGFHAYNSTPPNQDFSIRVWPRDDPTAERLLTGPRSPVASIALDTTGRRIAAGAFDGTLHVWDFKTGALVHREKLGATPWSLHFLDDARLLVGAGTRLLLLSADNGAVLKERKLSENAEFVVTADSKEAFVVTVAGMVHRVRLPDLEIVQSRTALAKTSRISLALSPDGSLLAATTQNGARIALLDPRTLEPLAHLPEFESLSVRSLAFDPKGNRFALAGSKVVLWDIALVRDELARLDLDLGQKNDRPADSPDMAQRVPAIPSGQEKPADKPD